MFYKTCTLLKNTSKHTCSDSHNLKPPAPLYPLQDFKALYKYGIIISKHEDIAKISYHWEVFFEIFFPLVVDVERIV